MPPGCSLVVPEQDGTGRTHPVEKGHTMKSMGQNASSDDAHPASGGESSGRIVVPSADMLAVVRFDDPPDHVPDELAPFVVRCGDGGDWVMTDDAVAFGSPDIVQRFAVWRATWERSWILDPVSNLTRLIDLARELDPDSSIPSLRDRLDEDDDLVLSPVAQATTVDDLARLADRIRARDATGYGIVDLTPGADRVGLVKSWPACGRDTVVAADDQTEIRFEVDNGLVLATRTHAGGYDRGVIEQVVAQIAGFQVSGPDGTFSVPAVRARPLAWLVPRSTAWRVRRIPEILAWARTLAGVEKATGFAAENGLDLRLTRHRPIRS